MENSNKKKKVVPKKKEALEIGFRTGDSITLEQKGQSSVELKRNSKGVVEFVVKVYDDSPEKAKIEACKTFESLDKKYK